MVGDDDEVRRLRDRVAELRRRVDEQQPVDQETNPPEAPAAVPPGAVPGHAHSPVRYQVRRGRLTRAGGYLALLLAIFLLAELSMTAAMFTGTDFADAERTGQATVRSCERHGPVGQGFGYWAECRADVIWSDGEREVLTPGKRGFFSQDEVGDTVVVGDLGYSRGGRSLAREERPPRLAATVLAAAFAMIAVLLGLAMLWVLWDSLRTGVRGLTARRSKRSPGPDVPRPGHP